MLLFFSSRDSFAFLALFSYTLHGDTNVGKRPSCRDGGFFPQHFGLNQKHVCRKRSVLSKHKKENAVCLVESVKLSVLAVPLALFWNALQSDHTKTRTPMPWLCATSVQ
jgi:hypothetical protein